MNGKWKKALGAAALAVTLAAQASPVPTELDPASNARVVEIANMLRCLVCQNQTIAESHAEIANDLRRQVIEQVSAGRSNQEIIDYMVSRYGDFVLYNPPFKATTVILWVGPFVLGILSLLGLFWHLRSRRKTLEQEASPLSEEERRKALDLLGRGSEGGKR